MIAASPSAKCVILGAGGHARVVLDALQAAGKVTVVALLDRNSKFWGREVFGVPIRGGDEQLAELCSEGATHFIVGIGSTKETLPRANLFQKGIAAGLKPLTVLHPQVICSKHVKIGEGTFIGAGAILNPGVVIGNNVIINTGAIVDHDCIIEDHVHIAPGVTLSGIVQVGSGAHIGTDSSIRQNIKIGERSVVGVGSVVVQNVPPDTIVKGVPAK